MPRAKRHETYRQSMFRKAWAVDLAADVRNQSVRRSKQDQLCNAIAYYCFLTSIAKESAELTPSAQFIKVDTTNNPNVYHEANLRRIEAKKLLKTCDEAIEDATQRAIKKHFIDGEDRKVAGLCLQGLRHDPNAVGFAFQLFVRRAAEQLFVIFNRKPADHEFHADFIRSESLSDLRIGHRVKKSA